MATSPCDPRTLTRAARDFADSNPDFAIGVGLAALRWIAEGHGYEITGADVLDVYAHILKAAEAVGQVSEVKETVRKITMSGSEPEFVITVLRKHLDTL